MPFLHNRCKTKHLNSNKCVKIKPKEGYAPIFTKDGCLYEGHWVNDNRQGFGVSAERIKNKTFIPKYRGDWHTDKRHGSGNGYYIDGGFYVGQWKRGLRSGYGRMWYTDESFYDGEWKCDRREGQGLFVEVSGDRYEGTWKNDKKHGIGRLYHLSTGQMQVGAWYEDAAICTTMEDIPFRQTAVFSTPYPIQPVELKNPNHLLRKEQVKILNDVENTNLLLQVEDDFESIQSDDTEAIKLTELQKKYKYI